MTVSQQILYVCLGSGLILFGAELFVPGGFIGALGGIALLGAIVSGFYAYPGYGGYIAVAIIFLAGAAFMLWMTIFPRTRLGNALALGSSLKGAKSAEDGLTALLNREGVTLSDLRPSGFAEIADRRVSVVTAGEMITRGTPIVVVEVEGNRVEVAARAPDATQERSAT